MPYSKYEDEDTLDDYNIKSIRRQKKRLKEVQSIPKHSLTSVRVVAEQMVKRDRERLNDQSIRDISRRKRDEYTDESIE